MRLYRLSLLVPSTLISVAPLAGAVLVAPSNTSFNWNATGAWTGSATWNSSTPDDASFSNSAGRTITIDAATIAGSVTVNQSANSMNFGGSNPLTINTLLLKQGAGSLVVNGPSLGGGMSIDVSAGTLELRNDNTFSGNVTVRDAATLRVSSANNALGTTGTLNLEGGSTFAFGVGGSGVTIDRPVNVTGSITLANTRNSGTASFSIGSTSRTLNLNQAQRTITASATNTGDIINILSDITNGGAGAAGMTFTGNATVRFGGSTGSNSYTGATILDSGFTGTLQLSKSTGVAAPGSVTVNAGTLMMRFDNNIADTSAVTLNGGTFRLQDEGTNNRGDTVASLAFNGGTFAGGGGLALGSGTYANGKLAINSGGTLSGGGTGLNLATAELNVGGIIAPGSLGNGNAGTLGLSGTNGLTWNGSSTAQMHFNLGALSDSIAITNALARGTGTSFGFDFQGYHAAAPGTFTLLTFGSTTFTDPSVFSATNITFADGLSGEFLVGTNALEYQVIPEPSTVALLAGLGVLGIALVRRRR